LQLRIQPPAVIRHPPWHRRRRRPGPRLSIGPSLNQIATDYAQHHAPERSRDIVWSMQHSAESLSAILEGLLDGQEA